MADLAVSNASISSSLPLVELRAITKSYGGVPVLKGAHMRVAPGEIHGLVGENGAGKSTLVKILAGEVRREGGEIIWRGEAPPMVARAESERLGITMIHQELNLAPHLNVAENIFLGHELSRRGVIDRGKEVSEARASLQRLGFSLDPRARVRNLSPAEQQLVEIARAVVRATRLVIMDEPTSSLSVREVEELFRVVRQLTDQGTAVIFVTHRLEELAQIADRVTVLRDGETVHEGPMPRADFGELIRAMVGRELKDFFPARVLKPGPVALEARDLTRAKDAAARRFEKVSFSVRSGEIVGLAGLVGAGRTELAEALFGTRPALSGQILIDGKEVRIRTPRDAVEAGMALLTEDRKRTGLTLNLPLTHNVTLANLAAILRRGTIDLNKEQEVTQRFVARLQIRTPTTTMQAGRLSGGNQQKVVLAKWLFREARIFLFDEPTRGVDVGAKAEIYKLMNQLAESGAAILMISSELPEILGMTDRVLVMLNGRIVKELTTAETTQEEIMRYAALGA